MADEHKLEMDIAERRERLARLARVEVFDRRLHASDAITAIDTLNKMDGIYKQRVEIQHDVIHTFVFELPDGTRFIPGLPAQIPEHTDIVSDKLT